MLVGRGRDLLLLAHALALDCVVAGPGPGRIAPSRLQRRKALEVWRGLVSYSDNAASCWREEMKHVAVGKR